jgi:hypothetical protein
LTGAKRARFLGLHFDQYADGRALLLTLQKREVIMEPYDKTAAAEGAERSARRAIWMRGLFMLLLMLAFGVGQGLLWLLGVVQFLWLIFSETPNTFLARFGNSLSLWLAEAARFVTCASEEKPFPWAAWPPSSD